MNEAEPIPFMGPDLFIKNVRNYANVHHMVVITDHAKSRMLERDLTRRMILRVLERGTLASGPSWNPDKGSWEGKVSGVAAGMRVSVVCAIHNGAMIVTVITAHRGGR
ncbi:hypothetical protein PH7735_00351 [Shimia thalassica]|uniref:DUF4258 domain-containing protein n=1 Tax=Shimia thalassica TaxID=1715693 RepID=A0A0N7M867_9RHOB|nr:hypothetical protein PH7735_00351 [Shimia thalassica]